MRVAARIEYASARRHIPSQKEIVIMTKELEAKSPKYDIETIKKLWGFESYEDLVTAPGNDKLGWQSDTNGRFTQTRFVMQAKVADEARRNTLAVTRATWIIALAAVLQAGSALIDLLKTP